MFWGWVRDIGAQLMRLQVSNVIQVATFSIQTRFFFHGVCIEFTYFMLHIFHPREYIYIYLMPKASPHLRPKDFHHQIAYKWFSVWKWFSPAHKN